MTETSFGMNLLVSKLLGGFGCLGGDFNILRFLSERFENSRLRKAMTEFFDFISESSLIDLPHGWYLYVVQ